MSYNLERTILKTTPISLLKTMALTGLLATLSLWSTVSTAIPSSAAVEAEEFQVGQRPMLLPLDVNWIVVIAPGGIIENGEVKVCAEQPFFGECKKYKKVNLKTYVVEQIGKDKTILGMSPQFNRNGGVEFIVIYYR